MSAMIWLLPSLISISVAFSQVRTPSKLEPFRTDGCSTYLGVKAESWTECCISHDFSYWVGGSTQDKQRADAQLINCLRTKGKPGQIAAQVFERASARFSQSRWGSRWNPPRPDLPLSEDELEQVKKYQKTFSLPYPIVENPNGYECSSKINSDIARSTGWPENSPLTCFDLKTDLLSADEKLVYSPNCLGYFVVQKKGTHFNPDFVVGYGECAKYLHRPQNRMVPVELNCQMISPRMRDYKNLLRVITRP